MTNEKTIQQIEYELKLNELKKAEKDNARNFFFSPTMVTLCVALLSLLGSLIVHFIQKSNELILERQKFESELIVTAVKANDIKTCRDNLKFLIEVGLINQNSLRLNQVLSDTTVPIFQLKSYSNINPGFSLEGIIVLPKKMNFENTRLYIWPHSTNLKETFKLRQQVPIGKDGKFKIMNLEEIGYVIDITYNDSLLKRMMYAPNSGTQNEFKIFDLSKSEISK
jgi:hypothetical protein